MQLHHYLLWFVFTTAFFPLNLPAQAQGPDESVEKARNDVEKVLSWLPADTESIADGNDFTIKPPRAPEADEGIVEPILNVVEWLPAFGFYSVHEATDRTFFVGLRVRTGVQAARKFRAPEGFGMAPFEGASILLLSEGQEEKVKKVWSEVVECASKVLEIEGEQVARIQTVFEEDSWSFFIA
ncbi:MAG: hypothetical protein KC931_26075, partial [Candidatus Omnitrophica bacterium]|nr:hypothetical protein [Candidatus Omnitrophota bacterium]